MKLYYTKGACSLAVRITINEIGIPCEFESVNLATKKTESGSDFLAINPKGAVPTLVLDDKQILTENATIQQYLAEEYKAKNLLDSEYTMKRYRTLEWLNFVATELHKGFSPFFNASIPREVKDTILAPALKKKIDQVDKHLQTHRYLMGEDFTIADSYLFVVLSWLPAIQSSIADWSNIKKYMQDLQSRNSVRQSLQEEQGSKL
jgi:glutathione S-transferase